MDFFEKNSDAEPFSITGSAADSDIYQITFTKALSENSEVRITFADPQDENLPVINGIPVDYTVSEKNIPSSVDLTSYWYRRLGALWQ